MNMHSIEDFILEIKAKREFLQHLIKNTDDSNVIQKILDSLAIYLQMEHHLSQLDIFIDDNSKKLIMEQVYMDRLLPYLMQSRPRLFAYLYQQPDLEYVNSLLNILSSAYSFSIPSLDIDNPEIIDLTKEFYSQTFHDSIFQEAMSLLEYSYILFFRKGFQ